MSKPRSHSAAQHAKAPPVNPDTMLHALPLALLLLGQQNTILYANFAAETFFGVSERVMKRRTLNSIVPFGSPLLALIDHVRMTGSAVNEYAVDFGLPEQGQKAVDVFAAPVPDDAGHIILTLQQRSVANLIQRQLTHRGAARSVSAMAAVLAHEIKNPLSGIRGAAQLLEAGASSEDKPLAQLIIKETGRICTLVDRMEVFGDERPLPLAPVNIHEVLDYVKQIAQTGFARHIAFIQTYDPSLPDIPGNRDKLVQAILNLVKNSAEAIGDRAGGHITLSTAFKPGLRMSLKNSETRVSLPLEIAVSDNGAGIPEDVRPHLFDAFVTTKPKGAGLGLALVAKIIGDHGGVIEAESKGRLTTFRMLLPLYQPASRK